MVSEEAILFAVFASGNSGAHYVDIILYLTQPRLALNALNAFTASGKCSF